METGRQSVWRDFLFFRVKLILLSRGSDREAWQAQSRPLPRHLTWAFHNGNTQSQELLRKVLPGSKGPERFCQYSSGFFSVLLHFSHLMQPLRGPKGAIWAPTPRPQARARWVPFPLPRATAHRIPGNPQQRVSQTFHLSYYNIFLLIGWI